MKNLTKRFPRYSKLLHLYPISYRKQYGEQMLQTLADMLDNSSSSARAGIWLRTAIDTPLSIVQQQAILTGRVMAQDMPRYVKRNSLVAALFLLPFFSILTINSLVPERLYHSRLWQANILFAWIVAMPAAALVLSGVTFLVWLFQQSRKKQGNWLKSIFDFRHNWPMLAAVIVGAGILGLVFFHDSTRCVAGNPFREAQEWHETIRCLRTGN
jgi:hypothetical protein